MDRVYTRPLTAETPISSLHHLVHLGKGSQKKKEKNLQMLVNVHMYATAQNCKM